MKMWNAPVMQELDVKLTASSGVASTTEAAGYLQHGWIDATYDSSIYEKLTDDATCTVKIENSASVES